MKKNTEDKKLKHPSIFQKLLLFFVTLKMPQKSRFTRRNNFFANV